MGRYEPKVTSGSVEPKAASNNAKCSYCILTCSGTCSTSCKGHASNKPAYGQRVSDNA